MKFNRGVVLAAVVAMTATLSVSGCSKKTTGTGGDVTRPTPSPSDTTGNPAEPPGGNETPSGETRERSLEDVFFAYDDHSLTAEARSILSGDASYLKEMSSIKVTIEGHCDERGTTEYNLALGQRRADSARNYLVELGIDGSRLATISYGEERPFEAGHDESAWAMNRRAHFRVTNP